MGVRFVNLNRKLWDGDEKKALAEELAVIICEGLDIADPAPAEATA